MLTLHCIIDINVNLPQLAALGASIMATLNDIHDDITQLRAGFQRISDEIQALKEQVAGGGVVTQQDLDDLHSSLQNLVSTQGGL